MLRIGVLALQGSYHEHLSKLTHFPEVIPIPVKSPSDLEGLHGIILPGGESTTISRLLKAFNLFTPLKEKIQQGLPTWGTCCGMILMATKVSPDEITHLGVMDIEVMRNAYGSQLDSFAHEITIEEVSPIPFPAIFIRAPWVQNLSAEVDILCTLDEHIVAVRQNHMIATSFHPELLDSLEFYTYFLSIAQSHSLSYS